MSAIASAGQRDLLSGGIGQVGITLRKRVSRPIETPVVDHLIDGAAALAEDVRSASREFEAVPDLIGDLVSPPVSRWAVHKWVERPSHNWTLSQAAAVTRVTGGAYLRAWLDLLASRTPMVLIDHAAVACRAAEVVTGAAMLNAQVAEDLAPGDDTPGTLDLGERRRLVALIDERMAELCRTRAQVLALR